MCSRKAHGVAPAQWNSIGWQARRLGPRGTAPQRGFSPEIFLPV
jgi:hypothetical protein